jgi:hypothetical protein
VWLPRRLFTTFLQQTMVDDKQEPVDEGVTSSIEAGEVEAPYSIYSNKEKWLIVGMVALAGFYRYVHFEPCLLHSCSGRCLCWSLISR